MIQEIDKREMLWHELKMMVNLDSHTDRNYWKSLINKIIILDKTKKKDIDVVIKSIKQKIGLAQRYDITDIERLIYKKPYTHIFETDLGDVSVFVVEKELEKIKDLGVKVVLDSQDKITFSQPGQQVRPF